MEVNCVRVVNIDVLIGEEDEGVPHKLSDCLLSPFVNDLFANEERELAQQRNSGWRVVINELSFRVCFLYLLLYLTSLHCERIPAVLEYINLLVGEVEPLAISFMNCLFELSEILVPILLLLARIFLQPLLVFRSLFSFLKFGVIFRWRDNKIFIGLSWKELHDFKSLQFKSNVNHQP